MSTQLQTNLENILNDKNTNLLPENLKAGITCLGVVGELQAGIDTSNATATEEDIALGKTAYVDGREIKGAIPDCDSGSGFSIEATSVENLNFDWNTNLFANFTFIGNRLMRDGSIINGSMPYDAVANAIGLTADKIVQGNKILGINGTAAQGLNTSDATATPSDLVVGKTAYVNGEKIEGVVPETSGDYYLPLGEFQNVPEEDVMGIIWHTSVDEDILLRNGAYVGATFPYSHIVDTIGLTPNQIVEGNTVLGVNGTASSGGLKYAPVHLSFAGSKESSIVLNSDELGIDFSNITDASYMFANCKNLTTISNIQALPSAQITDMEGMFMNCIGFTQLDLHLLDWDSVTNTAHMFDGCENVTWINMYDFDGSHITNSEGMFDNCPKLQGINVGTQEAMDQLLAINPNLNVSVGA